MYTLKGKNLIYSIDSLARCTGVYSNLTNHQYMQQPGHIWKMIYAMPGTETIEATIWADEQKPVITATADELTVHYDSLITDKNTTVDAQLTIHLQMADEGLRAWAEITNNDPAVDLMEIQLTPVSGVRSLCGDPENDYIAWPRGMGSKVRNPAFKDLSIYAGFRKYERHDQFHTDMDGLYQGFGASMQWFDWYNQNEGLYIGSEDTTFNALCLHCERATKDNVLRFGFIYYPMMKQGESFTSAPMVFNPHVGDWHAGARMYRKWMEDSGTLVIPQRPDWARDFTGWLRVILKQHHCECNWTFDDIPRLWDETEAAGFNTLYLLGWERGGFARMWPDYYVDEGALGGVEKLKAGIDYVHKKGGKLVMFLSILLIDHQSEFYKHEGGDKCTIKSIWNEDIPFSETYCGEGTYRKIGNPAMPMFMACPGAPLWEEKMKWAADQCLSLGCDGVLYDIGAMTPYFCYAEGHDHAKPSHSHAGKNALYARLRDYIRTKWGEDKIIMMENDADIYGMHMDIVHSNGNDPERRLLTPAGAENLSAAKDDSKMIEMYRYTVPEIVVTNRECGQDENHFRAMAGHSFTLGLRFDMTIFRCCGSLSDIPQYTEYLKYLNALYHKYEKHLLRGRFVDTDGFTWNNPYVIVKGYLADDGTMAAAIWNPTGKPQTLDIVRNGATTTVAIAAEMTTAIEIG